MGKKGTVVESSFISTTFFFSFREVHVTCATNQSTWGFAKVAGYHPWLADWDLKRKSKLRPHPFVSQAPFQVRSSLHSSQILVAQIKIRINDKILMRVVSRWKANVKDMEQARVLKKLSTARVSSFYFAFQK